MRLPIPPQRRRHAQGREGPSLPERGAGGRAGAGPRSLLHECGSAEYGGGVRGESVVREQDVDWLQEEGEFLVRVRIPTQSQTGP